MKTKIRVMKRGTYCEASVPDSTYFRAHPCERKIPYVKLGGLYLCVVHARMQREGRLK